MTAPFLIFLIASVVIVQIFVKLFCWGHVYSLLDHCTFWMLPFHNIMCQYFRLFDAILYKQSKEWPRVFKGFFFFKYKHGWSNPEFGRCSGFVENICLIWQRDFFYFLDNLYATFVALGMWCNYHLKMKWCLGKESEWNNQHSKKASLCSVTSINVTVSFTIALSFDDIHLELKDKNSSLVLVDFMPVSRRVLKYFLIADCMRACAPYLVSLKLQSCWSLALKVS